MNISEYYQYEADRSDNGETVRGYFAYSGWGNPLIHETNDDKRFLRSYLVKPETVRRVAVKPITTIVEGYKVEIKKHQCPNCKNYLFLGHPNFCMDCGQALDWSEDK